VLTEPHWLRLWSRAFQVGQQSVVNVEQFGEGSFKLGMNGNQSLVVDLQAFVHFDEVVVPVAEAGIAGAGLRLLAAVLIGRGFGTAIIFGASFGHVPVSGEGRSAERQTAPWRRVLPLGDLEI
jgi:hypothetical protein